MARAPTKIARNCLHFMISPTKIGIGMNLGTAGELGGHMIRQTGAVMATF
jgi:hypothetical protein